MNNNYSFIDAQNVNLGTQELGWKINWKKFRIYLADKYHVTKAYMFIGYIPENQNLYKNLQESGYFLILKQIHTGKNGIIKGNVDADLVLQAMIDINEYDKAVIITNDGDFYSLVKYLYGKQKLETLLSPNKRKCSIFLNRTAREKISFMDDLKLKIEYINEKAPLRDKTHKSAFSS